MIGMGIDASTTCIGYSIFDDDELITYGKLKSESDSWRERIQSFVPRLQDIISRYSPKIIVQEDVPLIKKQMITLVQLGAVQGMILALAGANDIDINFIPVATWRSNIGIAKGEKDRNSMKIKSIEKANEMFDIDLACVVTRNGNYNASKSDDDVADAILIYASTLEKYKVKRGIGRR